MGVVSRGVLPLVLIVDDDGPILDSLSEILVEEGYAVAVARDGKQALAYLAANPLPDCILLDVMMPVMNGYEFRRLQLRDPRLAAIPTLLLTAGHVDGRVADLRLSGWLRKPVNLPLLLATVQQHCRPREHAASSPFASHLVHLYLQEGRMLDRAAAHLADGLQAGAPALAVCTRSHWDGLQHRLAGRRLEPSGLAQAGRLRWIDAAVIVDQLRAGRPHGLERQRLLAFVNGALDGVAGMGTRPVQVFGEVVNLLWQDGQIAEALELEMAWNEVGRQRPMSLLCSYTATIGTERDIDSVCHQHAQVTRDLA
jgi:CheY-like chemotaxis protein